MGGFADNSSTPSGHVSSLRTANSTGGTLGPAFSLNFLAGNPDSRVTFTRASSGTYFDNAGLLKTALTDVQRFDYHPTTLAARGLLIEGSRTNIALYNRDFTNAAWVKTTLTALLDQIGLGGGAGSASSLTALLGNASILQTVVLASSARSLSAYVKRLVGTGTINMTTDGGLSWVPITVTTSWTRVSIPTQTLANPVFGFQIVTGGDSIAVDYIQNEDGTFPTSAIATTSAAVTRAADVASVTPITNWFNAIQGTLYAQCQVGGYSGNPTLVLLDKSSDSANYKLGGFVTGATPAYSMQIVDGGVSQLAQDVVAVGNIADVNKWALAYKLNDSNSCGRTLGTTDVACTIPAGINRLFFNGSANISFWLQSIQYYAARLPNTILQSLTA